MRPDKKQANESVWFTKWIKDGFTIKQLTEVSGYSRAKLQRIILNNLALTPPQNKDFTTIKHLIFDGKYLFGRKFCLLVIMDTQTNKPIAGFIAKAESKVHIIPWLLSLKEQGLKPIAVTTDGKQTAIAAFKQVWPGIITQRCLFHIKLQTRAWIRAKPKHESSRDLMKFVAKIDQVKSLSMVQDYKKRYLDLTIKHKAELEKFNPGHPIESDILRAFSLLKYALPHCFYYLEDPRISATSNALEGYFKQIQNIRGFMHCGLTEEHLFNFIKWKLYYEA